MSNSGEESGRESLLLKWGTLKGWSLKTEASQAIMQRYFDIGVTLGAMSQRDTPEQKKIICELIEAVDGPISNDWSGEAMTKDQAKEYVMNYGLAKATT